MLNLKELTNIRGLHSKFKRCVETPLAIEEVKDRGGDGDVKDNCDWWKEIEARIIKKTSSQLRRAWCHRHCSCVRARCLGRSIKLFGLARASCAKLSHGAQESLSCN